MGSKNHGRPLQARRAVQPQDRVQEQEVGAATAALELNVPPAAAYYLKEDLRQLWTLPEKARATRFLDDWIDRARVTGIRQLVQMPNTLSLHCDGLLAY